MDHRKIIHMDMDAFYASVEQRDFPEYRGVPLVVGGKPDSRGVVATASYEARKYGIRSAMPCSRAVKLCPDAVFVRPRFDVYKDVSRQIREIFSRYTNLIEPLSLDEAFLDVTEDKQGIGSAMEIARRIRAGIREELRLTASAGVSVNKFVAKIASDMNKPDGLTFIGPSRIEAFMAQLPVGKFFGVGRVTAERMKAMQLHTGADLKKLTEAELVHLFGKTGHFYYRIVRGIDERPVQPYRETKSLAAEDTFERDISHTEDFVTELRKLASKVSGRLVSKQLKGRTVTLKIKFGDFRQITRSRSLSLGIDSEAAILTEAVGLLALADIDGQPVRLLGLSLSNFNPPPERDGHMNAQLKLY